MGDDDVKPKRPAFVYTSDTETYACPACAAKLDAATGVSVDPSDKRPTMKIGSITTCAYCSATLVVTTIGLRLATDADIADLDPDLRHLIANYPGLSRIHK